MQVQSLAMPLIALEARCVTTLYGWPYARFDHALETAISLYPSVLTDHHLDYDKSTAPEVVAAPAPRGLVASQANS